MLNFSIYVFFFAAGYCFFAAGDPENGIRTAIMLYTLSLAGMIAGIGTILLVNLRELARHLAKRDAITHLNTMRVIADAVKQKEQSSIFDKLNGVGAKSQE